MTQTEHAPIPQPPAVLKTRRGSRLAALLDAYPGLKAAADEAATQLRAVTDGIKLEASQQAEGQANVTIVPPGGSEAPTLLLDYRERWSVDSRRLKAEDPETYVRYAKKSGAWYLNVAKGGADQ